MWRVEGLRPTHRGETAMNGAPGRRDGLRPTHRDEAAMDGAPGLSDEHKMEVRER